MQRSTNIRTSSIRFWTIVCSIVWQLRIHAIERHIYPLHRPREMPNFHTASRLFGWVLLLSCSILQRQLCGVQRHACSFCDSVLSAHWTFSRTQRDTAQHCWSHWTESDAIVYHCSVLRRFCCEPSGLGAMLLLSLRRAKSVHQFDIFQLCFPAAVRLGWERNPQFILFHDADNSAGVCLPDLHLATRMHIVVLRRMCRKIHRVWRWVASGSLNIFLVNWSVLLSCCRISRFDLGTQHLAFRTQCITERLAEQRTDRRAVFLYFHTPL